ncbi:restriction endonuclease subunit S [Desulfovibrio piger]|uniref:restriction endonuclease subunit S n=2 Tax=Desulfovibrio TaxID=872 RepID=UPI00266719A0|nr:restriction endonuclease subunit S [Desulfovibrio piger]
MKDSGIEWIGEIPEGWEISPLFSIFKERKQKNYNLKETNILSLSYGKIIRRNTETNMGLLPESFETYNIVDKSNIILRLTDLQNDKTSLRTGLVIERGIITSAYIALESVNTENVFFHYLLHCYDELKVFYVMGNGVRQNLKFAELSRLPLLVPPLAEQQRIADYLDAKCAYIDQCLDMTRQSMEKLRAYKLSCITETVTKGLDPDVPLKDSGVPWIGQIPAGWECTRLMTLCSEISTGPFGSQLHAEDYVENQTPLINPSNINNFRIEANYKCTLDSNTVSRLKRHILYTGEIIFARRGEMGRCALVEKQHEGFICGTGCLKASIKKDINQYYLIYYLQAKFVAYFLEYSSVGTTMNNLNSKTIASIPVTLPPLPEQERIAAYLDKKCARIDALLEEKQALLDKLAEYKKSLIFECVTGKREVPSCWNR